MVIGCDVTSAIKVQVRLRVLTPQMASQVGALVSTWPGSRRLLPQAQSSPEYHSEYSPPSNMPALT